MSWQAYVDTNLVGSGKVQNAAICGLDGTQWATSKGFTVAEEEVKNIVRGCSEPETVLCDGIKLSGRKYITIKADERSIYGKKGQEGVVAVVTGKAVVIGTYDLPIQPGEAATTVESLADYLINNGCVSSFGLHSQITNGQK